MTFLETQEKLVLTIKPLVSHANWSLNELRSICDFMRAGKKIGTGFLKWDNFLFGNAFNNVVFLALRHFALSGRLCCNLKIPHRIPRDLERRGAGQNPSQLSEYKLCL